MDNKFQYIISLLPVIEKITVKCEADYYGASYMISRKNNLLLFPRSLAGWKHGWVYTDLKYSEQMTSGGEYSSFLVPQVEHETFLMKKGIESKAVGMPFVYIEDFETKKIKRQKNTLLVMPPHSLPYTEHVWNENSYVEQINALKSKFDLIVVCIHQSCIERGLWVNTFEKYNISWIIGADAQDKNSLIRMYRIFNSFEFMTTNTMGSHIAYAAYCGCKVSIYGQYVEFTEQDFKYDVFYKKFPFLLKYNLNITSYKFISKLFPFLFSSPEKAEMRIEWAESQLGKPNKVSIPELQKLLGWSMHKQVKFFIKKGYYKIIKKASEW